METTVELVHLAILKEAAEKANAIVGDTGNADRWVPGRFNPATRREALARAGRGPIFRPDPGRSNKGGLCLSIDEGHLKTLSEEEIADLHWVGRTAIYEAIVENRELFVGLMVGEAKQGRNYFDRFPQPAQTRLF